MHKGKICRMDAHVSRISDSVLDYDKTLGYEILF